MRPLRSCIGCRQVKDKDELVRIVMAGSGQIAVDPTGHADGRGAYICRSRECLDRCIKHGGLSRAFKQNIGRQQTEGIAKELEIYIDSPSKQR